MAKFSVIRLLRMGVVRATIFGGVVYYTVQEGVWSSADDTVKVYQRIYGTIAPYVKDNVPKEITHEIEQLPSTSDVSSFAKTSWNKGIMTGIKFISDIPSYVCRGTTKLTNTIKQQINGTPKTD